MSENWFKGSLHCHSTNSDGNLSVKDLAQAYAGRNYDFVCLTDHWRTGAINGNGKGYPLLMINGIEFDGHDPLGSYYHVVAIGASQRQLENYPFIDALEAARAQGALLIWAHPYWTGNTIEEGLRHHFDGIEIYNHSSQCEVGKGYANIYWDTALERKTPFLGVAVDDAHFLPQAPFWDGGWVMVNAAECSTDAILDALRKGRFYSSQGPNFESLQINGQHVEADTSPIKCARLIGPRSAGKWIYTPNDSAKISFHIPTDWAYARLEIEDHDGKFAWTNPLVI